MKQDTGKSTPMVRRDDLSRDPVFQSQCLAASLSEELYRAMEKAGLNQSQLAKRLGVSKQAVGEVMGGNQNLTLLTLAKYCIALNVEAKINLAEIRSSEREDR